MWNFLRKKSNKRKRTSLNYLVNYVDDNDDERAGVIRMLKTSSKTGKQEIKQVIDLSKKFCDVINDVVEVKGEFAVSGQLEGAPLLPIKIKGYGTIGLPLYEEKLVKPLLDFFKKSPHGFKDKTILNESVRKSWELNKNEFTIVNPAWNKYIKSKIIPEIAKGMKLEYKEIEAHLYKLLLYEPGSFFKPHRDSEKENGMFGSLIIQLPSKYTGGELIIRHEGKEKIFDFGNDKSKVKKKEFLMFFSAFYCDLEHEVKPLGEGYRVSLVYNLISKSGQKLMAPTSDTVAQIETFTQLLNDWKYLSPKKFIYVLSHKYTMDGLNLDGLKNGDRNIGQFMKAVSDKTGLCVGLGILETHQQGTPFYRDDGVGHSGSYYGSDVKMLKKLNYHLVETYDFESFVKGLVTFEKLVICPKFKNKPGQEKNSWRNEAEISDDAMMIDFNNEVMKKESFKGILADQVDYSGWTGNEGVEMTRWYYKSVLVFWPKNHPLEEIWTATGDPPREIIQETDETASTSVAVSVGASMNPVQID